MKKRIPPVYETSWPRQPPSNIYHYTTREGLLGITESRSLWATNMRYLNDSREFADASEIALSVLDSFISETVEGIEKTALSELLPWIKKI